METGHPKPGLLSFVKHTPNGRLNATKEDTKGLQSPDDNNASKQDDSSNSDASKQDDSCREEALSSESHASYVLHDFEVVAEAPLLELLERFCDAIGEHEASNRFLLLCDVPGSVTPKYVEDSKKKLLFFFFLLDYSSQDWLTKRAPDFDKYHCNDFSRYLSVLRYSCSYERLIKHVHGPRNYCIIHKLMMIIFIRW